MKFRFLIPFLVLQPLVCFGENIDTEVTACFLIPQKKQPKCPQGELCTIPSASEKEIKCLEKLGLNRTNCKFKSGDFDCDATVTKNLFPQSRNLELSGYMPPDGKFGRLTLVPDKSKSARLNDFHVRAGIPAESAIRKKDGKWYFEKIGVPVGMDQIAKSEDTIITDIAQKENPPWGYIDGDGSRCDDQVSENFGVKPELLRQFQKDIGFDSGVEINAERHFVGPKGPKNVPMASRLMFAKDVKICGVLLPKETELAVFFGTDSCQALVNGAIGFEGFPEKLFPKLVRPMNASDHSVICAPKAQALSLYLEVVAKSEFGKKRIILPKLDWQQCDCRFRTTDDW